MAQEIPIFFAFVYPLIFYLIIYDVNTLYLGVVCQVENMFFYINKKLFVHITYFRNP